VPLVPKAATEPVKPPEPKSEAEASADSAPEIAAAETQNAEAQDAEAQDAEAQDAEAQVAPAETTALASPAEVEGVVPAPAEPAEDILASEPAVTHAEPEAQADIRLEAPAESLEGTTPEITPAAEDGHSETAAEAVVAAAPEAQADVAPETADASAASEEPLIEVWRPHRQHHHARRPDARGGKKFVERRERTAPGVATPPGAPADAPRPDAGPRRDRRHGDQRKPDHQPVAEGEAAAPAGEQRARVPHGGQDRGQGRPRGGEGPRDGQREGQRDQRRGGGPNRGGQGRPGQGRHDERQQGRGGHFSTEKRSHERPPDPNSPFAKLLALKAQLEDKNKDS